LRWQRAVPTFVIVSVAVFFLVWKEGGLEGVHHTHPGGHPARHSAPQSAGRVAFVPDGDTITLARGEKVRYLGIDSPEHGEAYYDEARAENRRLSGGKNVELRRAGPEERDRYGRTLALVYVKERKSSEPLCVNIELVRKGFASVYIAYEDAIPRSALDDLLAAQRAAMANGRGIWPTRLSQARRAPPLVATRFRIHRKRCRHLRSSRPSVVRDIPEEFRRGKSLCRTCKPLE
jgi:endonuclease YncB( thermonuclease family)